MMGGNGLYSPNPVAMLNMKNSHESSQLLANAYAEFSIYKGLKFRADYGHTNTSMSRAISDQLLRSKTNLY